MQCEVSVIVPAYNASSTIGETIDSVLSQTFANFEIIIVDDGSVDSTKDIVGRFVEADKRVKYFYQRNSGSSAARNFALSLSSGKYVALIDADDLWEPKKLELQVKLMNGDDDVIVLTGNRIFYDGVDGREFGIVTMPPPVHNERYKVKDILRVDLYQMVLINTALISRRLVESLGGWDPRKCIAEDWYFWAQASKNSRFRVIEEPLVLYRKHANSLTSGQNFSKVVRAHEEIVREFYLSGFVSKGEMHDALVGRLVEASGIFVYGSDAEGSARVLVRALCFRNGWASMGVWRRVAETILLKLRGGCRE